mmetsp:Transcript_18650/g.46563  ORF Transcript_18650/g.46563 Transcript_18650/m.46563 type:complete len:259 (+) Transcript_18650:903-1679(+)
MKLAHGLWLGLGPVLGLNSRISTSRFQNALNSANTARTPTHALAIAVSRGRGENRDSTVDVGGGGGSASCPRPPVVGLIAFELEFVLSPAPAAPSRPAALLKKAQQPAPKANASESSSPGIPAAAFASMQSGSSATRTLQTRRWWRAWAAAVAAVPSSSPCRPGDWDPGRFDTFSAAVDDSAGADENETRGPTSRCWSLASGTLAPSSSPPANIHTYRSTSIKFHFAAVYFAIPIAGIGPLSTSPLGVFEPCEHDFAT